MRLTTWTRSPAADPLRYPVRARTLRRCALWLALSAAAAGAAGCSGAGAHPLPPAARLAAVTRLPAAATTVLAGSPELIAVQAARHLLASAPVLVIANARDKAGLARAAAAAVAAHAPLLLIGQASAGAGQAPQVSAAVRTEIGSLKPRVVLAVGLPGRRLSADLRGIPVVTAAAMLPPTRAAGPVSGVAILVREGRAGAGTLAAVTTARAAGAQVIPVRGDDPRADPAAIAALSAARPRRVLAIGAGFGPAARLASRVAVAVTGVQLPGGGQVLFPMRRLVALYGYPGTPSLGALGEQGLTASIRRVSKLAALYRPLSAVPVVPAFEILATVAQGSPGYDGTYSYQTPISVLRPWVRRANAAGLYVVLDLQPGRASLLTQAMHYRSLLRLPDVGLALDPEWKLQPGQRPLRQIGSVDISEVNSVVSWLAALTEHYHLPQKLLVLHQFRLSMIIGEQHLDTRQDALAIVIHMDGQGTPFDKEETWRAVTGAAPAGVFFGWKNFFVKDHPMLTPQQTMEHTPLPVMISYE